MRSHTDKNTAPYEQLTKYLKRVRSFYLKTETIKILLSLILYLLAGGIILAGFFGLTEPGVAVRTALFFVYVVGGAAIGAGAVVKLIFRGPTLRAIAIKLERTFPHLRTRLIAGYDLHRELSVKFGYSSALIERACEKALESTKEIDYRKLAPKKAIRLLLRAIALTVAFVLLIFFLFPDQMGTGTQLALHPFALYTKPPKTILIVSPGDAKVVKLEDLKITIRVQGEKPRKVNLFRKPENTPPIEFVLRPDSTGDFSYTFKEIRAPFEYYAEAEGYKTPHYKVLVVDKPRILSLQLIIQPPSYTGLPEEKLDKNDGNVNALYGSTIKYAIKVSKAVSEANILLGDSTRVPLRIVGDSLAGTIGAKRDDTYKIVVVDKDGNTNPDPIQYRIRVYPDEMPVVRIISPAADVDISEEMKLEIAFSGEDDYGFSSFFLKYRRGDDTTRIGKINIPFKDYLKKRVDLTYNWDLSPLKMTPNEIVTYWIEGYDNDFISGPKLARSREYSIRLPSLEEIIEQVTSETIEQTGTFVKNLEEQKKLAKEIEKFSRDLQGRTEMQWEDKQKAQEILEKQEKIAENLKALSQDMQKTIDNLEKNALVASEIIEKIQEIQRILEDIMTPEMKAAMDQLRRAMENMDPNMLREALKKLQENVDELLSKLDQTLTLLKRIQIEQKLQSLIKLTQELKEMQDKINEALASGKLNPDSLQKLAASEKNIEKGVDYLEKSLEALSESMNEFPDMPKDQITKALSQMKSDQIQKYAQNAKESMESNNQQGAEKEGQNVSEGLKNLLSGLNSAMEGLSLQVKKEILQAIQRVLSALFYISNNTEETYSSINANLTEDEALSREAERANGINEELKIVIDELYDIGGKTFLLSPAVGAFLGKAKGSLDESVKRLTGRNPLGAKGSLLDALAYENAAIQELMKSMESVASSSSPSGMQSFFEQLQKICDGQGQLNIATLPLASARPGGLTPEQQAAFARLAAQQEALRKSLEELQREYERFANLQAKFDDVLKDMEEVTKDLTQQNVNDETIRRQNRIYSRMLEAQKSLHQRDYTERRESKTGKDIIRSGPAGLPENLGENKKALQEQLLRALSEPYPREYDKQIKAYFRRLEEMKQ